MAAFTLTDADGGTNLLAEHDNLPPGLSPVDNETGWRMALDKLEAFVESGDGGTVLDGIGGTTPPGRR